MLIKGDGNLKESNFQLMGKPRITKILFETNNQFNFEDGVSLEVNNNVQVIKNSDKQENDSIVVFRMEIFQSRDLSDVPFKINLEIEGNFKWDDVLAKDTCQLDSMLKQNAPAILYSYLRPIITLITVEANMPPLVIPLMNFYE